MDSFGGEYTSLGRGSVVPGRIRIDYPYPKAVFPNLIEEKGQGWSWTITSRPAAGGPETPFARYTLQRAPCSRARFAL